MSDHIVSYWTQFRRDKKREEGKELGKKKRETEEMKKGEGDGKGRKEGKGKRNEKEEWIIVTGEKRWENK